MDRCRASVLLVLVLLPGCINGPAVPTSPTTPDAPAASAPPPTAPAEEDCASYEVSFGGTGPEFTVAFVNDRGQAACLEILLDGSGVFKKGYPAPGEAGPAYERQVAGRWEGTRVSLRARESVSGLEREESFDLRSQNHFVVTLGSGLRIDRYDGPPTFA